MLTELRYVACGQIPVYLNLQIRIFWSRRAKLLPLTVAQSTVLPMHHIGQSIT
jgi:hypothetical protein